MFSALGRGRGRGRGRYRVFIGGISRIHWGYHNLGGGYHKCVGRHYYKPHANRDNPLPPLHFSPSIAIFTIQCADDIPQGTDDIPHNALNNPQCTARTLHRVILSVLMNCSGQIKNFYLAEHNYQRCLPL